MAVTRAHGPWAAANAAELNPTEADFVAASIDQRHTTLTAQQRSKRRLQRAFVAVANANASQAIALAPTALQTSLLLAVEGWKRAPTLDTRGGLLTSLNGAQHLVRYLEELPRHLFDTALTPDRQRLATITDTGTLQLWNTSTWQIDGPPLLPAADVAGGMSMSQDGRLLAITAAQGARVFDLKWDASTLARIGPPLNGHGSRSGDVRYSADGTQVIAAFDDGSVNIWDADSGTPILVLLGHNSQSTFEQLSGGRIFTASGSEAAEWDLAQPAAIGTVLEPVSPLWITDVRPTGSSGPVAVGGSTRVELVDNAGSVTAAAHPLGEDAEDAQVASVAVSADGRYVAWAGLTNDQGTITRMQIGRLTTDDLSPAGAEIVPDELDFPGAIALSPDGSIVAVGTRFGKVGVFDASTGTVLHPFEPIDSRSIGALSFTADGRELVVGGQDGVLRVFETANWSMVGEIPLAPGAALRDATSTPGGSQMFITSESGEVFLIDLATRVAVGAPFVAGGTRLQGVAISPDGATLVASSRDGAIRFWDVASHRTFGPAMRDHRDASTAATYVGPDQLFTGGLDGQLIKWDLRPDEWAATACRLAGRNLTQAEWNQFLPGRPYVSTCAQYPPGS